MQTTPPIPDPPQSEKHPNPSPSNRKLLLGLADTFLLWFFDLIDYSLPGMWADAFIPIIGLISGFLLLSARRSLPQLPVRPAVRFLSIATLLESFFPIVMSVLMLAFAPMGIIFVLVAISGERPIQSITSPDGTRIAECYENNLSPLRVKYTFLPIVERDIVAAFGSSACGFRWEDNDTLYSSNTKERIHLGTIQAHTPPSVESATVLLTVIGFMARIQSESEENRKQDEIKSAPLKDIPIYPGGTENDNSGADMLTSGGFRAFDIQAPNSDEAASWYKQVLSQGEWSVVSTKRREFYAETGYSKGKDHLIYNCIDSLRREADGTTNHYYWRFLWDEQSDHVRVIVDTPESSPSTKCD